MIYPTISQYIESIKDAEDSFATLTNLRPVLGEDGNPIMSSGNFAVVFKMKDNQTGKFYAVKCFLKDQPNRDESYKLISEELKDVASTTTYLTKFKYLEEELFVDTYNSDEDEFPVLLMDWVEGVTLDRYIVQVKDDKYLLSKLVSDFSELSKWLMIKPFAHGDIKPDNIMVRNDNSLVLIDYDGMYVPTMKGQKAREIGSKDFRHPLRTESDFNSHIDDFSIASILLSLRVIAYDFNFYITYGASDRLLFTEEDYRNISECKLIKEILKIDNNYIKKATYHLIDELLGVFDFLPFSDLKDLYGYKKGNKFYVCNNELRNISLTFLNSSDENTVFQGELSYYKNIEKKENYIILILDKFGSISIKAQENTYFFVPRLLYPSEYLNKNTVFKGNIFESVVGDKYVTQDLLILNGKKYNTIKYLFSIGLCHVLGRINNNRTWTEYFVIDKDGKLCFYTKEIETFILRIYCSEFYHYGIFDIIAQNEDEIWYLNSNVHLKKYKKQKSINLGEAYVDIDNCSRILLSNHLLNKPTSYFFLEFDKRTCLWFIGCYAHDSIDSHGVIYTDYDLEQVVIYHSSFVRCTNHMLVYQDNSIWNKKPYSLYKSDGEFIGNSEYGKIYETSISIKRKIGRGSLIRYYGLYDLGNYSQLLPNNFNSIDYRIVDGNVVSIVRIGWLTGVFLNDKVIIPLNKYEVIEFNHWSNSLFWIKENKDSEVKKLYRSDGTYITDYKYAVAPLRYGNSWQEELKSDTIFKVYDKNYDYEYKKEEHFFRLCIKGRMASDLYFKSVVWCRTFDEWQYDVFVFLKCVTTDGKYGIFNYEDNEWAIEPTHESIEYDRIGKGLAVFIVDHTSFINSMYKCVYSGKKLKIVNYSWIAVLKDIALNRFIFYDSIKDRIIDDVKIENGIICGADFKFSIEKENYIWLKEPI